MVLVMCVKLDGVRWAGSSEYMACSTRFDEVLRVCAKSHPIEPGSIVLAMSTTSIVRTSDCLYIICSHLCLHVCVYDIMEGHTVLAAIHHSWLLPPPPPQVHNKGVIVLDPYSHHTLLASFGEDTQLKLRKT